MAELSEELLLFAHDIVRPEDGGDHLPVKLASARSHIPTVQLATRIEALIAAQVVKEREACVQIAQQVKSRQLGHIPIGITVSELRARRWKIAGVQQAADEIISEIRARYSK